MIATILRQPESPSPSSMPCAEGGRGGVGMGENCTLSGNCSRIFCRPVQVKRNRLDACRLPEKESSMRGRIVTLLMVAAALLISTGGAWASVLINIQANYYDPGYPPSFDPENPDPGKPPVWTPSYTGGAVIGSVDDKWNQLTSTGSVNPTDYLDAVGNSTGVTLTGNFPIVPFGGVGFTTGSFQGLMSSYIYDPGAFSFKGLKPNTLYDLYIYTQGAAEGRTMNVWVNGVLSGTTTQSDSTLSDFVLNKNYLKITADSGISGQLDILPTPGPGSNVISLGDKNEADINAMQLTEAPAAVPEPSTYLLLCLSLGAVGFARKRLSRSGR